MYEKRVTRVPKGCARVLIVTNYVELFGRLCLSLAFRISKEETAGEERVGKICANVYGNVLAVKSSSVEL